MTWLLIDCIKNRNEVMCLRSEPAKKGGWERLVDLPEFHCVNANLPEEKQRYSLVMVILCWN